MNYPKQILLMQEQLAEQHKRLAAMEKWIKAHSNIAAIVDYIRRLVEAGHSE